jgi:tRNA(His) 5'-end guanylyltransferase
MSSLTLKDRIESYQKTTNYTLIAKVPIIININGKNFSKLTSLLDKPYDNKFAECIFNTSLRICNEVEGVVFAYQHSDEITLILRNDQNNDTEAWFDNNIQKICSVTSAIATMHFNDCASTIKLNTLGDPIFISQVFPVPTVGEAINTMVYKQQHSFLSSLHQACLYELLKKHDKNTIREMLSGLGADEKIELLKQESNIDFNDYPSAFKRGTAYYKVPKVVDGKMKAKWFLNSELPIFTRDQSFLSNILKNGMDIFREGGL